MKISKILFLILFFNCSLGLASTEQPQSQKEQELDPISQLDWKLTGTYKLPLSHSTLSLPAERVAVFGKDAKLLSELSGNGKLNLLEAVTVDDKGGCVYFESYNEDGYVTLDDWTQIDSKQFLASMIELTEEGNKERLQKNISSIHVIRWIQEPILNKHTYTVYWAIELTQDGDPKPFVNSTALRLGRHGYERVTWITSSDQYIPFGGELDIMLHAHGFDDGYKYSDHSTGDKVASYGIATLVAATAGAKIAKAGGLLFLIKKLGGFLAVGAAALLYKIKNILKKPAKNT